MKQRDDWKRAEYLMYNYTKHLTLIELLSYEYQILNAAGDVKAQSYNEHYGRHTRDPVAEYNDKLDKIMTRIAKLKMKVQPVTSLINELTNPYALDPELYASLHAVLIYIYFGHNTIGETAEYLKLSRSSIYRRKRHLVKMLISNDTQKHNM